MKLIEALIEKALAKSKKLRNAVKTANEVAHDLRSLAEQVSNMASAYKTIAIMVQRHEHALQNVSKNQEVILDAVDGGSIDTSLPSPKKSSSDKDKPN